MSLGKEIRKLDISNEVTKKEKKKTDLGITLMILVGLVIMASAHYYFGYLAKKKERESEYSKTFNNLVFLKKVDELYINNKTCISNPSCIYKINKSLEEIYSSDFIGNDILYLMDIPMIFSGYKTINDKYLAKFQVLTKYNPDYKIYIEIYSFVNDEDLRILFKDEKYKLGGIFKSYYNDTDNENSIEANFSEKPEFKLINKELYFFSGAIFVENLRIEKL